ncbi:MAG: hypothetical protein NTY33_00455 [Candidatus Moranbacteria bacterium]|nr:hypothetical protein [Candidatus Moranbacteria bacterium]
MVTANNIPEKTLPFFQELEKNGKMEAFDVSDWLIEGTDAFNFANTYLTAEEREELLKMVYASMLLEA